MPSERYIAAVSVNHVTLIWEASSRSLVNQFKDHTHFVQGVAWDPHGTFLVTQVHVAPVWATDATRLLLAAA